MKIQEHDVNAQKIHCGSMWFNKKTTQNTFKIHKNSLMCLWLLAFLKLPRTRVDRTPRTLVEWKYTQEVIFLAHLLSFTQPGRKKFGKRGVCVWAKVFCSLACLCTWLQTIRLLELIRMTASKTEKINAILLQEDVWSVRGLAVARVFCQWNSNEAALVWSGRKSNLNDTGNFCFSTNVFYVDPSPPKRKW